jgi:hypothetical protein
MLSDRTASVRRCLSAVFSGMRIRITRAAGIAADIVSYRQ